LISINYFAKKYRFFISSIVFFCNRFILTVVAIRTIIMQKQQQLFQRKKLVIAVGLVMLGGVLTGCDNSNDPEGPGPLGSFTILANGGAGGDKGDSFGPILPDGQGGNGGSVIATGSFGGLPVEVVVHTHGVANTAFTTPVRPPNAANLGDNPLQITTDTTIDRVVDYDSPVADGTRTLAVDELYVGTDDVLRTSLAGGVADYTNDPLFPAGTDYLREDDYGIYLSGSTVAADDVRYSGLSVAAGATLALGENWTTAPDGAAVSFREDIDNSGIITRATANVRHNLTLASRFYLASGNIANAGVEGAAHENGGHVQIFAANGIINNGGINTSGFDDTVDGGGRGGRISLDSGGYVLNSGLLDTSGGDGEGNGGSAGDVDMFAAYTESTGDIDMSGGNNITTTATAGIGGNGGDLDLFAEFDAVNGANVDGSGGNGDAGGAGGDVSINGGDELRAPLDALVGEVKNAGNINLNGGVGSGGQGGSGGNMEMATAGGDVLSSGDLSSAGGDASAHDQNGGAGGNLSFMATNGAGESMAGSVEVSGFLNMNGGNATVAASTGAGGNGGSVSLDRQDIGFEFDEDAEPRVALLGYVSIDANGGDGANGGHAGDPMGFPFLPAALTINNDQGAATNWVPVNARGGNSIATGTEMGNGGNGGRVSVRANGGWINPDAAPDPENELRFHASNKAAIDVSGGTGVGVAADLYSTHGGNGGGLDMASDLGNDNSGAITASGGAGGRFNGGSGGTSNFDSGLSESKNTAQITANGADGATRGGRGGRLNMFGATSVNTANITLNGGNATETDLDAYDTRGGDGGHVDIMGLAITGVATNTGTLSYSFGTGEIDGEEGSATIGIVCEANCTP
jgi:hypothetical protein